MNKAEYNRIKKQLDQVIELAKRAQKEAFVAQNTLRDQDERGNAHMNYSMLVDELADLTTYIDELAR